MKLVACMCGRNEQWIAGLSVRVALLWCDAVVCVNHASTDETSDILAEISRESGRVVVIDEPNPSWDEMRHRGMALDMARHIGATHIAIVDFDEVLSANLAPRAMLDHLPAGSMMELPGYNLRGSLNRYHLNGMWGHRWFSTAFRDDPMLRWEGDTFHHREPMGRVLTPYRPIPQGSGGVLHLWGASEKRLRAKHRAYRIQERLRWPDKPAAEINRMYGWWEKGRPEIGDTPAQWKYAPVPESWWAPYGHLMKYLDVDAEPWQDQWVDEMIAQHGTAKFAGLEI